MEDDGEDSVEDLEGMEAALRAALQFAVGEICSSGEGMPMTGSAVSTLTEVVFKYSAALALDLRCFAKHGKRAVVGVDDVKLVGRKDPKLVEALTEFERANLSSGKKKAPRKKKGDNSAGNGKGKRIPNPPRPPATSPPSSPTSLAGVGVVGGLGSGSSPVAIDLVGDGLSRTGSGSSGGDFNEDFVL